MLNGICRGAPRGHGRGRGRGGGRRGNERPVKSVADLDAEMEVRKSAFSGLAVNGEDVDHVG
ncbi:hypothetical protein OE88DRAFT_1663280 [Heliocybe sulcata]|uniref:Chromatin target of PRMT1 protein C-terminal domain-containing protein n=1 Tax=Heliocybe sulcata TaxID=5364 RepID=A0A5C3MV59_9AGAM|nr:hypothetical protein OE88DRAFT_1663280 [Heliocybe sulcata]